MILVTGARGVVGTPLIERLSKDERPYLAVSRAPANSASHIQWDLSQAPSENVIEQIEQVSIVIHCAPIWLLPDQLPVFKQLKNLVVFSSTSVLSKQSSPNNHERQLVDQLGSAEKALTEYCQSHDIALTIFRPSMIYGYGRDQNISHIASFIRRFGVMLLVGSASGLRQPVHADDLVQVAFDALEANTTNQYVYTVAGKDVISYREMVTRIFIGMGRRPRILHVPLWLFRTALTIAARLGRFSYTPEMANRMNQDLNYDYSKAAENLGFKPQGFLEHAKRDLVNGGKDT